MSVKVSSWVWEHSKTKGTARLVLLALADIANDDGEVVAYKRSQRHLAKKVKAATSTVRDNIETAVALGELEIIDQGDGRQQSNYRILMRVPESGTLDSDTPAPESGTQGGSNPAPCPPESGTQGAAPPAPHHDVLIPSSLVPMTSAPLALVPDEGPDDDELFEMFWKSYPRKVDKPGSKRAFKRALKVATVSEIGAGLRAWKAYWTDPEFIPHPKTWLNQQRWNDEVPEPRNPMPASADTITRWLGAAQ